MRQTTSQMYLAQISESKAIFTTMKDTLIFNRITIFPYYQSFYRKIRFKLTMAILH